MEIQQIKNIFMEIQQIQLNIYGNPTNIKYIHRNPSITTQYL